MTCRLLGQPSQILSVTLPRPVGIVFEEDKRKGRATICGFLPGSNADKQAKVKNVLMADCRVSYIPFHFHYYD